MGKTIAITGVNGYAASTILPLLEADDQIDRIIGIDCTPWIGGFNKVSFFREDIRSSRIADILQGADIVCHAAFADHEMDRRGLSDDIGVEGSKNVLAACEERGIKKILFISTIWVYGFQTPSARFCHEDHPVSLGKNDNGYHAAAVRREKVAHEFICRHPDTTVSLIRSATLMGPRIDNALEQNLSMKLVVFPSGNARIQYIHESDFGNAIYLFIRKDIPGVFNLSSDDSVPAQWCFKQTGAALISLPAPIAIKAADIGFKMGIYPSSGDRTCLLSQSVCADNTKFKKAAGWEPAYTSEAALMAYADKVNSRRAQDNQLQAVLSWIIKSGKRLKPFLPVLTTFRLGKIPGIRRMIPWLNPEKNSINYLPVNETIDVQNNILPTQVAHDLIESTEIHVIMDKCGCRMLRNCGRYTQEVGCLFMGDTALKLPHGVCRQVSKQEAHAHADRAIGLGLLPMIGKVRIDNFIYMTPDRDRLLSLCFCCDCCCILTSYKHVPGKYLNGIIQPIEGLLIEITDNCIGCGTCIQTCAFNAISVIDGRARHNEQCRGCGRCERFCPSKAVRISIENDQYSNQIKERIRSYVEF